MAENAHDNSCFLVKTTTENPTSSTVLRLSSLGQNSFSDSNIYTYLLAVFFEIMKLVKYKVDILVFQRFCLHLCFFFQLGCKLTRTYVIMMNNSTAGL